MNHRDTETQRGGKAGNGKRKRQAAPRIFHSPFSIFSFSLCLCISVINLSCGSKPTDLRTLAPAETLVYLETNDLGAALQPIIDSKPFTEAAKSKPDLSALKGVQVAVAITGFETSEEKLTDEQSVGKIQPHFVAIADTHAWNFQAVKFAQNKLGSFVANIYDSEPKLEQSDEKGGKYFTWTAGDGRKAYALVIDGLVYFTNDASAIEKCLAVKRGEADSIAKDGKVKPADPGTLASGYISTDGVAQIANIAALKFASDASDESEIQSAIAGILPKLIRGTITDATWTQTKTDQGIEDKWQINMPADVANVFNETMAPSSEVDRNVASQLRADLASVTLYDLRDPALAWRALAGVIGSRTQVDVTSASAMMDVAIEAYGPRDGYTFLSGTGSTIVTAQLSPDGDEPFMVARIVDLKKVESSLSRELVAARPPAGSDAPPVWKTEDGDIEVYSQSGYARFGSPRGADMFPTIQGEVRSPDLIAKLTRAQATVTTVTKEQNASNVVELFLPTAADASQIVSTALTETRFNNSGMERKTTSDFGFIGWIIAQVEES